VSNTKYAILGLLVESPLSGYDIKKLINIRFRFFWNESYGQIYPELKRLSQQGHIQASDRLMLPRGSQVYQITQSGVKLLETWVNQAPEKESIRIEMLLKIYHGKFAHEDVLTGYIQSYERQHQFDLNQLMMFKQELLAIPDPYGNHQDILDVIEFGIKTNVAYLEWCKMMLSKRGSS
jgi:DNA-binding PadR family transcriptional regulator